MKPQVIVLKADGVNRDEEMAFAFELAGAKAKIVHINDLRSKKDSLRNYEILALPGGFAYGDDIVSGKILAIELTSFFADELKKFVERKNTATIGVCNGFQALIRTGLLPFGKPGEMHATLSNNESGHFECRWIQAKAENNSVCKFLDGMEDMVVSYPIAHGEGRFFTDSKTLTQIEKQQLVAFRYVDEKGNPTHKYPQNPNGSLNEIMGICDPSGRILGLMPHPECFVRPEQHPNWRREKILRPAQDFQPQGLQLFQNIVNFVKKA